MTDSYFLKIVGIRGESADDRHRDEIDIESWSWGETNAVTPASGGAVGKVQMRDFLFSMRVNRASPALLKACATGERIRSAKLTGRKDGKGTQEYLTVILTDVSVVSFQTSDTRSNEGAPLDQFTLSFSRIEYEYKPAKPDGSLDMGIRFSWDLKMDKPV